ncbi:PspC domain-containing protein [Spirosoma radiotolerans]|uniref:Phage-shock protein n=1 Tax=Spirosoma radiotolerans TaxID=1379870 RepID=A0A0E3ZX01_9BACT|nr:PspC domain-containing protein [Spirosoma radiotolerans]AKD55949.1 phage-shock protein [Spirosoma radiotolerans]
MKKTISINISGVIFHIEEDGYDKLKNYLSTVQQYFSTYEDSQEIVTDIENRIAEKLLAKLKAADKQVVSLDDVNELVAAMGTVADFEAVEEEEVLVTNGGRHSATSAGSAQAKGNPANGSTTTTFAPQPNPGVSYEPRRLVRDLRRKTLGGVCAGLAHYFNMDVVWVRLIFVGLFIGLPALSGASNGPDGFFGGLSGFTFIVYIAMWIALPGVVTIEDDKTVKKFFRNPEDKVLGGVASGIAAYFGIDTGIVRLLFVLGIVFFGVGFLLYLVLWMIAPTANTLTEKMEMQGQPITLSNIENSIKQNLNINETANNESALTRILLFPFRAIATILGGLGRALGPLLNGVVSLIRVFAGVLMLIMAFAFMIACLAFIGAAIGIWSSTSIGPGGFPSDLIRADVTAPMVLSGIVVGLIPAFALAVLGIMLITTRSVISTRTALTLGGIWLVGLVVFGGTVTPLISSFQRRGTVEETKILTVPAAIPMFALNDVDNDGDNWDTRPSIDLKGYEGTTLNLVQSFRAQGRTRAEAQANARQVRYAYTIKDSVVRFDNSMELLPKAHFRAQDLDMDLMIPYEKPFRMTEDFARYIRNEFGERELDRMSSSLWKFTKQDGLVCINYPREKDHSDNDEDNDVTDLTDDVQSAVASELGDDFDRIGDHTRQFNVTAFSKVDIAGAFVVRFRKGDTFKVIADGREDDMSDMDVRVNGSTLEVKIDRKGGLFDWNNRKRVGLTITVPNIDELKLSGASKASLVGFGNYKNLDIDMSGACRTVFDGTVEKLSIQLSGASNAVLRGHVDQLEADLSGASKIEATGLNIDKASVDASGASHATLGHVGSLDSETSGASKVTRQ